MTVQFIVQYDWFDNNHVTHVEPTSTIVVSHDSSHHRFSFSATACTWCGVRLTAASAKPNTWTVEFIDTWTTPTGHSTSKGTSARSDAAIIAGRLPMQLLPTVLSSIFFFLTYWKEKRSAVYSFKFLSACKIIIFRKRICSRFDKQKSMYQQCNIYKLVMRIRKRISEKKKKKSFPNFIFILDYSCVDCLSRSC